MVVSNYVFGRYIPLRSGASEQLDYTTAFAILPEDTGDQNIKENAEPAAIAKPCMLATITAHR